jgi:hypothetical protein
VSLYPIISHSALVNWYYQGCNLPRNNTIDQSPRKSSPLPWMIQTRSFPETRSGRLWSIMAKILPTNLSSVYHHLSYPVHLPCAKYNRPGSCKIWSRILQCCDSPRSTWPKSGQHFHHRTPAFLRPDQRLRAREKEAGDSQVGTNALTCVRGSNLMASSHRLNKDAAMKQLERLESNKKTKEKDLREAQEELDKAEFR